MFGEAERFEDFEETAARFEVGEDPVDFGEELGVALPEGETAGRGDFFPVHDGDEAFGDFEVAAALVEEPVEGEGAQRDRVDPAVAEEFVGAGLVVHGFDLCFGNSRAFGVALFHGGVEHGHGHVRVGGDVVEGGQAVRVAGGDEERLEDAVGRFRESDFGAPFRGDVHSAATASNRLAFSPGMSPSQATDSARTSGTPSSAKIARSSSGEEPVTSPFSSM